MQPKQSALPANQRRARPGGLANQVPSSIPREPRGWARFAHKAPAGAVANRAEEATIKLFQNIRDAQKSAKKQKIKRKGVAKTTQR